MDKKTSWSKVCQIDEIDDNSLKEATVDGTEIILLRNGSDVFACPALCPHMDERLINGFCDGNTLICTKHLWQWDMASGEPVSLAEKPLTVFPIRIEHGDVYIQVPTPALNSDG